MTTSCTYPLRAWGEILNVWWDQDLVYDMNHAICTNGVTGYNFSFIVQIQRVLKRQLKIFSVGSCWMVRLLLNFFAIQQHQVLSEPQVSWFLISTWQCWKQKQFLLQRPGFLVFLFKQHSKDLFTTRLYRKVLWLLYHHLVTMEKPHKACVLSCLLLFSLVYSMFPDGELLFEHSEREVGWTPRKQRGRQELCIQ